METHKFQLEALDFQVKEGAAIQLLWQRGEIAAWKGT